MFLNPRYYTRSGAGLIGITILSTVTAVSAVRNARRGALDRGDHQSVRPIMIMLIPLVLLPAVARYTSTDSAAHRLFVSSSPNGLVKQQAIVPSGTRYGETPEEDEKGDTRDMTNRENPRIGARNGAPGSDASGRDAPGSDEPIPPGDSRIVVTAAQFDAILSRLWDDPERYAGRQVSITGFSYYRETWGDDLFVVARMLMWCCAADAYIVGLAVETSNAYPRPRDGQWIEVDGILGVTSQIETGATVLESVPTLRDVQWRNVPPPESEYVFPAF